MQKKDILIISIILLVALVFRLYKINIPLAELHSWRQVDTASVARNFVKDGFNLLIPRYDDLSNIQSGHDNPRGLRFVEFPLYNATFAALYKLNPVIPLEIYGRLTTIFFSLIIIFIIYYLVLKEIGRLAAATSALVYAVFPFFVFFSRVVLPDTMALSLSFISIFFLYLYSSDKNKTTSIIYYLLSLLSFSLGVLVKPMVIFYGLTLLYLFARKYKFGSFKKIQLYLFFIVSAIPFLLWREYISHYPEGVPESLWLIFITNTPQGKEVIFMRPAFFRWIFFERINNLIMGGLATFILILGIVRRVKNFFFYSILISALLFLLTFQGGNIQHEYYQILILPAIAIFTGLGLDFLFKNKKGFINQFSLTFIVLAIFALSFFFSFYEVRNYYNYPGDITQIAKVIKTLTLPEDKIITDTTGDTTLLYLSERRGSPAPYKEFEEFKKEGYKYFITFNSEVINAKKIENKYKEVFENNKFAIFKL